MPDRLTVAPASAIDLRRHLTLFHSLWTAPKDDHHAAHTEAHLRMHRPGTVNHQHDPEPSPEAEEHSFW